MTPAKGLLVFYINVGSLPPYKAEAFVERMKDMFFNSNKGREWCIPNDVGVVFIPTRTESTYLDYINFDGFNISTDEAETITAKRRIDLLENLKIQLIANNPELAETDETE